MGFLIETDELRAARARLSEMRELELAFRTSVKARLHAAFEEAGGCGRCGGRGWIVTWDTLDSLSGCYAEYGTCPEEGCSKESREKTGLDMGYYHEPYDRNRHVRFDAMEHMTAAEAVGWAEIEAERKRVEAGLLSAEAGAYCAKGAHVRVVRGRKVPRGTMGEVFWTGKDKYRGAPRVGMKDGAGTTHWTAGANLELIEAAPGYYHEGSY